MKLHQENKVVFSCFSMLTCINKFNLVELKGMESIIFVNKDFLKVRVSQWILFIRSFKLIEATKEEKFNLNLTSES